MYTEFACLKRRDKGNMKRLWKAVVPWGVYGRLPNAAKNFCNGTSVCVRVSGGKSEWLAIDTGVPQGCVVLPRLFDVFMEVK